MFEIPQDWILEPHLLNIFLTYLLFILSDSDIADFSDSNASYLSDKILHLIESLQQDLWIYERSVCKWIPFSFHSLIADH